MTKLRFSPPQEMLRLLRDENSIDAWDSNCKGTLTSEQLARLAKIKPDINEEDLQKLLLVQKEHFPSQSDKTQEVLFRDQRSKDPGDRITYGELQIAIQKFRKLRVEQLSLLPSSNKCPYIKQLEGDLSADSLFAVFIKGEERSLCWIEEDWWRELREQEFLGKLGRWALHYFDNWCTPPPILSLQPLDVALPPSDAKLKHVVGVGDDGELVYDDEVSEARETTEIIEIERRDRTNFSDR